MLCKGGTFEGLWMGSVVAPWARQQFELVLVQSHSRQDSSAHSLVPQPTRSPAFGVDGGVIPVAQNQQGNMLFVT